MTIACLAWGSLHWNPQDLPIVEPWQCDGPALPLEFARQSENGRITLVIIEAGPLIPVLWVPLDVPSIDKAVEVLAKREGVTRLTSIGRVPHAGEAYPFAGRISAWAEGKGLTGVVWTALKPGLRRDRGRVPKLAELVVELEKLSPEARAAALEYVERAPEQIQTAYRADLLNLLSESP